MEGSPQPLTSPPRTQRTIEESLEKLRQYDFFHDLITDLEELREEQFRAMKSAPVEEVQQIAGAITILTDLLDQYRG